MCQMTVVMKKNDQSETIMKDVIHLEATAEGTILSSFFERNVLIPGTQVIKIDFLKTTVTLGNLEP